MIIDFLFGFIYSIGFYFLFYRLNRPTARWRSVALMASVILSVPFFFLWQSQYNDAELTATLMIMITVFRTLSILICALLGANPSRMLVPALFINSIINMASMTVGFFMAFVLMPIVGTPTITDAIVKFPQLNYSGLFLTNLIVAGCCLLAARLMRGTKAKPPFKICLAFCLLFIISKVITLAWSYSLFSYQEIMVKYMSFLALGFLWIHLLGTSVLLFYLYTRLVIKTNKETENQMSPQPLQGDYTQFIQHLSKRELELIEAVLAGNVSHKELAIVLNISVNTVKTHLKNIYQITGVSNIAALSFLFTGFTLNHR